MSDTEIIRKKWILVAASIILCDRLYAGQTGLGLLKIFTCGGCGLWAFIDFMIISYNALSMSKEGIFGVNEWNGDNDISLAFYIQLLIVSLTLISYFLVPVRKSKKKQKI